MIIVAANGVLNALDLMVDAEGADLLIDRLKAIRERPPSHIHIMSPEVHGKSPYGHEPTFPEIIVTWIGGYAEEL